MAHKGSKQVQPAIETSAPTTEMISIPAIPPFSTQDKARVQVALNGWATRNSKVLGTSNTTPLIEPPVLSLGDGRYVIFVGTRQNRNDEYWSCKVDGVCMGMAKHLASSLILPSLNEDRAMSAFRRLDNGQKVNCYVVIAMDGSRIDFWHASGGNKHLETAARLVRVTATGAKLVPIGNSDED